MKENKFKTSTILECLMQDVPKLIKPGEKVGYTHFDRWFCFSACKNNLNSTFKKLRRYKIEDILKTNERNLW